MQVPRASAGGGEELSEAELAMFLIQLLVAGNETTRNLISGGLVALAEHPEQWAALRADRSLVPGAVEELLRWTTPVISFMRTATGRHHHPWRQTVAAGDPVLLVYASANRDEEVFGRRRRRAPHRPPSQPARELRLRAALLPGCGAGPARGPGRPRRAARPLRNRGPGRHRWSGRPARSSPASGTHRSSSV